jgi:hypothetical protein
MMAPPKKPTRVYSRESLLKYAQSPYSTMPPENITQILLLMGEIVSFLISLILLIFSRFSKGWQSPAQIHLFPMRRRIEERRREMCGRSFKTK